MIIDAVLFDLDYTLFDSEASDFTITVINTQDNSNYEEPPGVQGEYDEINNIREKEQSLVLDFYPIVDNHNNLYHFFLS